MDNYTEEDYARIEAFLNNELTPEELKAFRERQRTDARWAAEVAWYEQTQKDIFLLERQDFFAELTSQLKQEEANEQQQQVPDLQLIPESALRINNPVQRPERTDHTRADRGPVGRPAPSGRVRLGRVLGIAASLLLLLVLGYYFLGRTEFKDRDIAKRQTPPEKTPNSDSSHSTDSPQLEISAQDMAIVFLQAGPELPDLPTKLESAATAYQNDDPDEALRQLQLAKETRVAPPKSGKPVDDEPAFGSSPDSGSQQARQQESARFTSYKNLYTGLAYLKKNDPEKALSYLKQVKAPLQQQANWYQALAYIQENKNQAARSLIEQISTDQTSPYRADAQELLKKL